MKDVSMERLTTVFGRVFGTLTIDDSVSVMTLDAWDSLRHLTLILELENEFGVQLSTDEAIDMTSIPDIVRILNRKLDSDGSSRS